MTDSTRYEIISRGQVNGNLSFVISFLFVLKSYCYFLLLLLILLYAKEHTVCHSCLSHSVSCLSTLTIKYRQKVGKFSGQLTGNTYSQLSLISETNMFPSAPKGEAACPCRTLCNVVIWMNNPPVPNWEGEALKQPPLISALQEKHPVPQSYITTWNSTGTQTKKPMFLLR